jgi:hypothetical protein
LNRTLFYMVMLSAVLRVWAGTGAANSGTPARENLDEMDAKGRTLRDIREDQRRDSIRSAKAMKEREDTRDALVKTARLDADTGSCLAFNRSSRECLISVGRFNELIPDFIPEDHSWPASGPSAKSPKTIRGNTLAYVLDGAFRDDPGNPYPANVMYPADKPFKGSRLPPDLSEKRIADLYRDNFAALTRRHGKMNFEIYASTY